MLLIGLCTAVTDFFFLLQIKKLLLLVFQNTAVFLQAQHLTGASRQCSFFMGRPGEVKWISTFHDAAEKIAHLLTHWSPSPNESINPSPSVHAWWRRPLIISNSPRRDTGVRRGPPASVIRHRGQTRASLLRLRHVPREGSTPLSTPPLRGLPIHTTRWRLDLSFNECYPSPNPFRSRRTTVAPSTSRCSLLPHTDTEQ